MTTIRRPTGPAQTLASIALVILLASTWIIVKFSLNGAPSSVVAAGRTLFSTIGLGFILTWKRVPREEAAAQHPAKTQYSISQITALALLGVVAYTVFSTLAIATLGPSIPSLILTLSPVSVLIMQAFTRRQVPPGSIIFGTCLAALGAWLFAAPQESSPLNLTGIVYAVLAMLSISLYGVFFEKVNTRSEQPLHLQLLPIYAAGSLPLLIWGAIDIGLGATITFQSVILLAVLGILVYTPTYLIQHHLILTRGAQYTSLLGLTVAPTVLAAAWMLNLGPPPSRVQLAATTLVILGMAVVLVQNNRRGRP